jgi:hypothetical protein
MDIAATPKNDRFFVLGDVTSPSRMNGTQLSDPVALLPDVCHLPRRCTGFSVLSKIKEGRVEVLNEFDIT